MLWYNNNLLACSCQPVNTCTCRFALALQNLTEVMRKGPFYYVKRMKIYPCGPVNSFLAGGDLSSADNLCKQFGPRLGSDLDPNHLTL